MSTSQTFCIFCPKPAKFTCNGTGLLRFCSKEHKDLHCLYKKCLPIAVSSHPNKGRLLLSSRDIKAGEVIFTDTPLAVGPNQASEPICLGCHKPVNMLLLKSRKCSAEIILVKGIRETQIVLNSSPVTSIRHQRFGF